MIFATQKMANIESAKVREALTNVTVRFVATGNEMQRGVFQLRAAGYS